MEEIEPDDLIRFYSYCASCGAWIEFARDSMPARARRENPLTREEVEAMGFVMRVRER